MSVIDQKTYTADDTWTKPPSAVLVKVIIQNTTDSTQLERVFAASILAATETINLTAATQTLDFGAWLRQSSDAGDTVTMHVVTYGDFFQIFPQRGQPPPRGLKWTPRHQLQTEPQPDFLSEALRVYDQPIVPVRPPVPAPQRQSVLWPEPALQDAVYAFDQIVTPVRLPVPAPQRQSVLWMEPAFEDALRVFHQDITAAVLPVPAPREDTWHWPEPEYFEALRVYDQPIIPVRLPDPAPREDTRYWPEPGIADAIYAFDQIITPVVLPVPAPREDTRWWPEPGIEDALSAFHQDVTAARLPLPTPWRQSVLWPEPALQDALYAFDQLITPVRLPDHERPAQRREFVLWSEPALQDALYAFDQIVTPPSRPEASAWPKPATPHWPEPEYFEAFRVHNFSDRGKPEYPHFRPWPRIITSFYPEFVPQPPPDGLPGVPVPRHPPGPILTADDDVAQAVMRKWEGVADLLEAVPGGLQRGRLTPFQPNVQPAREERIRRSTPYATFTVSKSREGLVNTGNFYLDFRLAVIEIRGTREQVEPAIPLIREAFHEQRLETQQAFLACLLIDDAELTEDPARRQGGEDVWIVTVRLEVWTDRDQ